MRMSVATDISAAPLCDRLCVWADAFGAGLVGGERMFRFVQLEITGQMIGNETSVIREGPGIDLSFGLCRCIPAMSTLAAVGSAV